MKQVVQNKKMIRINHTEVSHTELLENHAVSGRHFSIHKKQIQPPYRWKQYANPVHQNI